jgi:hypothetical protein
MLLFKQHNAYPPINELANTARSYFDVTGNVCGNSTSMCTGMKYICREIMQMIMPKKSCIEELNCVNTDPSTAVSGLQYNKHKVPEL